MSDIAIAPRTDESRYSLHEEEDVVETPPHRHQIEYLESNLRVELPDRFVVGNVGVYWVPGEYEEPWVGPDVLVSRRKPDPPPKRVYLVWEHGPIQFVAEVASRRTRRTERRKREQYYRVDLQIPEYLYIDLDRHLLELRQLRGGEYRRIPEQGGRLYSQELDMWFGWAPEEEFVWIWTADGRRLLTKEEEWEQRQAAEQRAREAEQRTREAEAHAAALAEEVDRLRRTLAEQEEA